MVKPDAVNRGLVGEIVKRFEQKGYKLVAMKMIMVLNNLYCISISHMNIMSLFTART